MSPAKRQPSKQKRTAQNRQQRAALQARKAAATSASSSAGRSAGGAGRSSLLGRLFGGGGGGRLPRAAAMPSGGAGGGVPRVGAAGDQPVGFRAALAAVIAALAAIVLTILQTTPVNADGELYTPERVVAEWSDAALSVALDQPDADATAVEEAVEDWSPGRGSERLIQALWPASLAMVLPLGAAYLAFRAVRQRRSSRIVNRAMYATLFGALLTFNLFIFFLPAVVAVSIAGFQVRKAEAQAAAAAAAAEAPGEDGDVIDAEVVEDADGDGGDDDR